MNEDKKATELFHDGAPVIDATGRAHAPAGSSAGGQFVSTDDGMGVYRATMKKVLDDHNSLEESKAKNDPNYKKTALSPDEIISRVETQMDKDKLEKKEKAYEKMVEEEKKYLEEMYQKELNDIKGVSQGLGEVKNALNSAKNVVPNKPGKYSHPDYKKLSNQDLKEMTERIRLENEYANAKGEMKYAKSGNEKTREILEVIGSVAGVASALAMAYFYFSGGSNKK